MAVSESIILVFYEKMNHILKVNTNLNKPKQAWRSSVTVKFANNFQFSENCVQMWWGHVSYTNGTTLEYV